MEVREILFSEREVVSALISYAREKGLSFAHNADDKVVIQELGDNGEIILRVEDD